MKIIKVSALYSCLGDKCLLCKKCQKKCDYREDKEKYQMSFTQISYYAGSSPEIRSERVVLIENKDRELCNYHCKKCNKFLLEMLLYLMADWEDRKKKKAILYLVPKIEDKLDG